MGGGGGGKRAPVFISRCDFQNKLLYDFSRKPDSEKKPVSNNYIIITAKNPGVNKKIHHFEAFID
jgi:hypothetical protein